ncbi:alpha/beta hydrolase [Paenibacillus sp. N1-5-1-14]|uniref:alpha/beta hydrolase n=1 Tax=Paenibacillus radicibacter TaxID=2972488 RepID=UPI0021593231|nr:alpha/beta hydrolase [Paenibacillus radicibacter]MCR8641340.1 alpha/beta hydrolase [Paenibacillus radicibacter]
MITEKFTFMDPQNNDIFVYCWKPNHDVSPIGVVQLAHGMAEHAGRYVRVAEALTAEGYIVYANDHRGHGRTAHSSDDYGFVGYDGFHWLVHNLGQLSEVIRERHPNLPLILMGHSMGSFLVQNYMYTYPDQVDAFILSGTGGKQSAVQLFFGTLLARNQAKRKGENHRSILLNSLTFGKYNSGFKPTRTEFDWLTRDEEEVDQYVDDPMTGAVFTASFYRDFFTMLKQLHKRKNMELIPRDKPVYIFAGDKDPVGFNGKGILDLVERYKSLGITNLTYKLYPDARHETLNEVNRDEVTKDLITQLNDMVEKISIVSSNTKSDSESEDSNPDS